MKLAKGLLKKPEELFQAIKAGTLNPTQANAEVVKDAYAESVMWNATFEAVGLADLPDPEGIHSYEQVFEDWLALVYRENFNSSGDVRAALHQVRDQIRKDTLR
jgi:hypothetical protein